MADSVETQQLQQSYVQLREQVQLLQQQNIQLRKQLQQHQAKLKQTTAQTHRLTAHTTQAAVQSLIQQSAIAIYQSQISQQLQAEQSDRQKAEEALKASEAKFRSLIQHSSDLITILDPDGLILYLSDSIEKILGDKPEDLIGTIAFELIHPEDVACVVDAFNQIAHNPDTPLSVEYRIRHKDGSWRFLESTGSNLFANPAVKGMVVNSRDITERKQAQELQRENQRRLSAIFNNTFQFTGLLTPDGILLEANQAALNFAGLQAEDVIGRPLWDTPCCGILPETKKCVQAAIVRAARGEFVRYELEIFSRENTRAIIDFSLKPLQDGTGQVMQLIAEGRDITELKRTQQERDRFFNNSTVLMVLADFQGDLRLVNPAWETTLGFTEMELEGKPYAEYIHPDDLEGTNAAFQEAIETGQIVNNFENRCRCKDGSYKWLSWNTVAFPEEGLFYAFARDITHSKQAEEQLKASLEEKEVLLKEVHHRVKNNLQIISSLLDLQSLEMEDQKAQDAFRLSQNRVKSMALIHESLYQSTNLAKINFANYIKTLASYLISTYAISSQQITLDLNNIDDVCLDINTAIPCGLILNELVANSLKYACFEAINYEIVIKLKVEDNQVNLIVKDSGKNLPNAISLDKNPSLGLKLVKALVEQIDGQMGVEQSPCTTFRIKFPLS